MKTDDDLWYKIDFEQMNLLGYDNPIPWYGEESEDIDAENLVRKLGCITEIFVI